MRNTDVYKVVIKQQGPDTFHGFTTDATLNNMGVNNTSFQPIYELYTHNSQHATYMGIYKEYRLRAVRVKYTLGGQALESEANLSDAAPLLFGYAWSRTC